MNKGKKYTAAKEKVEQEKAYNVDEGLDLVPDTARAGFDETVDIAGRLGVNPKHPEQMVRGSVVLPNGTGRKTRVLVFAKGEKEAEATEAGADFAGSDDMLAKVRGGWLDFDATVATPDMMGEVGKLGKILGPRGLMPNPKLGTVTFDVARAVTDLKAGKVEFRVDKAGNIHVPIGKVSFGKDKLRENLLCLMDAVVKAKPSASKGVYLKNLSISTTMGPGIKLDTAQMRTLVK